jgi:hypothetical protein
MPIVSTVGEVSGGSTALTGSSSVLGWCQYARCGFVHMGIQHSTAPFLCRKLNLKGIGMLSANAGHGASCAQASSRREWGL